MTQLTPTQLEKMQAPIMDQYTQLAQEVNWDDMRMKKVELGLIDILRKKSYRYRSIFTVSNMGRNQTVPILLALVQLGVLEFVASEDTTQVEGRWRQQLDTKLGHQNEQDPFEVLEVHWTSGTEKVKASYERMKKEYENFARGKELPSDVEAMRQKILENIEVAFVAVKDKASRQATRKKHYEPQQHDFSADLLFRQGEMLLVRHKYVEAIDDFERAVELMPGVAKYKQMLQKAQAKSRGGE